MVYHIEKLGLVMFIYGLVSIAVDILTKQLGGIPSEGYLNIPLFAMGMFIFILTPKSE